MLCVRLCLYTATAAAIQMSERVYVYASVFFSFDIGLSWARMRSRISFFLFLVNVYSKREAEEKKLFENGFSCYTISLYIQTHTFFLSGRAILLRLYWTFLVSWEQKIEIKTDQHLFLAKHTLLYTKWSHMIMIDGQTLSYTDVSNHFQISVWFKPSLYVCMLRGWEWEWVCWIDASNEFFLHLHFVPKVLLTIRESANSKRRRRRRVCSTYDRTNA